MTLKIMTIYAYEACSPTYGTTYHAIRAVWHGAGEQDYTVQGIMSGRNAHTIPYAWHGGSYEPRDITVIEVDMKMRDFDRMVKGWEYAGCTGEQLAAFIKAKLAELEVKV